VTSDYALGFGAPDEGGLLRFLCEERGFSRERVQTAIERMRQPRLF
jgi:flap endonuclease-1